MKVIKLFFVLSILIASIAAFASNLEVIGNIDTNTTWTGVDSIKVTGDIYILDGITLTIDPGMVVEFQGHYKLDVQGTLLAVGTASQMITFTADDHDEGWNSIVFDDPSDANATSYIEYCLLEYGKATTGDYYNKYGGALWVWCYNKVRIYNCIFSNNYAGKDGGAIFLLQSDLYLKNNLICNNEAYGLGGGIAFFSVTEISSTIRFVIIPLIEGEEFAA